MRSGAEKGREEVRVRWWIDRSAGDSGTGCGRETWRARCHRARRSRSTGAACGYLRFLGAWWIGRSAGDSGTGRGRETWQARCHRARRSRSTGAIHRRCLHFESCPLCALFRHRGILLQKSHRSVMRSPQTRGIMQTFAPKRAGGDSKRAGKRFLVVFVTQL